MTPAATAPVATAPATAPVASPAPVATAPAAATAVAAPAPAATPIPAAAPVTAPAMTLTLPEGSLLDASVIEKTVAEATALGLSPEKAQEALNGKSETVKAFMAAAEARHVTMSRTQWVAELKADKDFGGDRFDETAKLAGRAIEKFGDPELSRALNASGFGNYPALVRWAARVGRAMSEDGIVRPNSGGGGAKKTFEETFYGETTSQT